MCAAQQLLRATAKMLRSCETTKNATQGPAGRPPRRPVRGAPCTPSRPLSGHSRQCGGHRWCLLYALSASQIASTAAGHGADGCRPGCPASLFASCRSWRHCGTGVGLHRCIQGCGGRREWRELWDAVVAFGRCSNIKRCIVRVSVMTWCLSQRSSRWPNHSPLSGACEVAPAGGRRRACAALDTLAQSPHAASLYAAGWQECAALCGIRRTY
jgi:hypothetical protein